MRHRVQRQLWQGAVRAGANGLARSLAPASGAGVVDTARGHGNVVSFTFDDGPNPPDTYALLAVLKQHRVRAVFGLWGDHVVEHPEVVRAIVAGGHVLCNHTMHHEVMQSWTAERIRADLLQTGEAIRAAVPDAAIPFFRAPFGEWGVSPGVAAELGMRSIGWRLAVEDWETPGTDVLVQRLLDGITPGSVVLLHDGGGDRRQTVAAMDTVIPLLRARNWRFTLPAFGS
jgi:peptidoglycan/xylan/chitin deacetylase (PgdA/CDA1 family)